MLSAEGHTLVLALRQEHPVRAEALKDCSMLENSVYYFSAFFFLKIKTKRLVGCLLLVSESESLIITARSMAADGGVF